MAHTPRNKATTVVYLILRDNLDRILVMDRWGTGYRDGDCQTPAGHIDAGETPTQAILRETKEEIGVELVGLRFAHASFRPKHDETGDRCDYYFEARGWHGHLHNAEPDKHRNLRFVEPARLPQNMTPHIRHAIRCIEYGVVFSELGYDFLKEHGYMSNGIGTGVPKSTAMPGPIGGVEDDMRRRD